MRHFCLAVLALFLVIVFVSKARAQAVFYAFDVGGGYEAFDIAGGFTPRSLGYYGSLYTSIEGRIYVGPNRSRFFYGLTLGLEYMAPSGTSQNLMDGELGLGGLGFFLTQPLSVLPGQAARGRWFATVDVDVLNVRYGGNITPGKSDVFTYLQYVVPLTIRAWYMLTDNTGVGVFAQGGYVYTLPIDSLQYGYRPGHGYEVKGGLAFTFR